MRLAQQPVHQPRAQRRIAPRRLDPHHFHFGRMQRQPQRKRIVNVIPNIRIEDHLRLPIWNCRARRFTPSAGLRRRSERAKNLRQDKRRYSQL